MAMTPKSTNPNHHPPASPASPASPATKDWGASTTTQEPRTTNVQTRPNEPEPPFKPDPSKSVDGSDFHLAKAGTRDYVAGQPVDEKDLAATVAAAKKRIDAGSKPLGSAEANSEHQYGTADDTKL